MEDPKSYYIDLANRYFAGDLEQDDQQMLVSWAEADPENRKVFEELRKTWMLISHSAVEEINTSSAMEQISPRLDSSPVIIPLSRNRMLPSLKVAAIIILLLIPGYFVFRFMSGSNTKVLVAGPEMAETNLPDGSHITLKNGSELEYPASFSNKERFVKLQGQACFDVTHDGRRPFIIASGNIRIRVLGTSFHVNTHADGDQVEVILSRGKNKMKIPISCHGRPALFTLMILPCKKRSGPFPMFMAKIFPLM